MLPKDDYDPTNAMRGLVNGLIGGVLIWCVIGGVLWALYNSVTLPIVYESYTTGNCVRVDDVRGVYTCENMPRKHHHQWLQ